MKIGTGNPPTTGRYACYMHGVAEATVVRFWLAGTGWLNNLKEPIAGTVAGWVGPLPTWPENSVSQVQAVRAIMGLPEKPPSMEYDL